MVSVPRDCLSEEPTVDVTAMCYEDRPVVQVMYVPPTLGLERVHAQGEPIRCTGMAPGVQICGDLPGEPGEPVGVTTWFTGDIRLDWMLTAPACPATETEIGFGIIPGCYPTLGPVITISYSPADQPLVSANADGTDLTCEAVEPGAGLYMCHGIPGAPGSEMTITFCLADGSCFSGPIAVRDCEEEEEPSEADWRIAGLGCHDETRIFFIIDTGLEWLVPGAAYTYSAWDTDTGYSCSVHPTIPGRLYCSGVRPDAPGELQVCVQQDGAPSPTCDWFADWPAQEDTIPDCAPEVPPPPVDACSVWTNYNACEKDHPPCRWNYSNSTCYTP